MQLIVIRERQDCGAGGRTSLLRSALSMSPLSRVILDGWDHLRYCGAACNPADSAGWTSSRDSQWVLPRSWRDGPCADALATVSADNVHFGEIPGPGGQPAGLWTVVVNGRFATCVNHRLLMQRLAGMNADVIAVNAAPDLRACHERVRLTSENELVGYRRLFSDLAATIPTPADWPDYLLVRPEAFEAVARENLLGEFRTLADACRAGGLRMRGLAVAGSAFDLESEAGLLAVCGAVLNSRDGSDAISRYTGDPSTAKQDGHSSVSEQARLIGPVVFGKHVAIESGAVIVGPAVLCDGCVIGRDAVIDRSVVGAGVSVERESVLRNRFAAEPEPIRGEEQVPMETAQGHIEEYTCGRSEGVFRFWPRFSYAGSIKRIVDVVAALAVLTLFAPVIPLIALAIRINSPGPVFFRHKRQGLHGDSFDCIKFRTMRPDADKMQDKLRFVCEVDGPQFKMADDPRITAVGHFLRETYLDEIPQFYNVLCGQMSVVGPRPSPESENTLCPLWRDARLSVRPGITGLWQVQRTRVANRDFQEWIHFDTQYVRDLSPGLDLWICWRTFRRMVENFVNQF